jgi:hypothetical protein
MTSSSSRTDTSCETGRREAGHEAGGGRGRQTAVPESACCQVLRLGDTAKKPVSCLGRSWRLLRRRMRIQVRLPRCEIRLARPSWWGGAGYRFKGRWCGEWWSSSTNSSHHFLVCRGSIHGGAEYPFRMFSALQGESEVCLTQRYDRSVRHPVHQVFGARGAARWTKVRTETSSSAERAAVTSARTFSVTITARRSKKLGRCRCSRGGTLR